MATAHPAAQPEGSSPDPLAGTPYAVVRKLSRGGQADVYLAQHREMGGQCVVKLPHGNLGGRHDAVERWLQEARILARLGSPHIVRVINGGRTESGRPFIALEALEGETLQVRLRREGRLSPKEALQVAVGVLRALEDAHAVGVVHRDLKPDNLFLHKPASDPHSAPERGGSEPGWVLKVLDFGIAKVIRADHDAELKPLHLTAKSQVLGTPRYLAPEQIAKEREVDARTDLYAVGLILFVSLVGEGPFDLFHDVSHLLGAHLQVVPSRVSEHFEQRHPGERLPFAARFDEILARALRKQPEQRYQSARELRMELSALLEKVIASEPFYPGNCTGKYHLERLLAQDRTSSVWKATDPALGRAAVVKILEPDHVDATVLRRYFEHEARALADIRHPNVVGLYDFGYERGRPWIAMEVAPGTPLRRVLARGPLGSPSVALELCAQIAAGVWEAHRRGVAHGNLSPANVFVDLAGECRAVVADFGTTATFDRRRGALHGALAYQAPEQIYALGDRREQNMQADVFALGVIAYELLSGQLPFQSVNANLSPEQHLRAQLFEDPVPLHQHDPRIPPSVSAVVARALRKEPGLRYPTMRDARAAFEAALDEYESAPRRSFASRVLTTRLGALISGAMLALFLSALVLGSTAPLPAPASSATFEEAVP